MSSKKIASIPLSYDWGRKVEPPRGSPNRQQWHTWKHEFPIESPPRKTNRAYVNKAVESQRGTFVSTQEFLERTAAAGEPVIPQWAKNEKTVLSFSGFFLEAVNDSADEIFRVREVVIKYWVLDGSMAIVEPTTNNSGMPQGALVKRHKIVKPDSSYLKLEELRFGNEIEVYGKKIRIVNCDQFTRKILSDVDLGEPEEVPTDSYTEDRRVKDNYALRSQNIDRDFKNYIAAMSGQFQSSQPLGDYLKYDGKILIFKARWETTQLLFKYFLSTKEVQVLEQGTFEGKDPFPTIFKRNKLPLDWRALKSEPGGLPHGTPCYGPKHFSIGATIDLYGRDVLLTDADEFTREWYSESLGIDLGAALPPLPGPPPLPRNTIPSRDAFTIGSDEDTIQSCLFLVPPKPRKDMKKLMDNAGKVLRFTARMVSDTPIDRERKFVIKFFLEDDTMMVFQQPVANLGIVHGKFRERSLMKKADGSRYSPSDFAPNKRIVIASFVFELLVPDDFTRNWYDKNQPKDLKK